MNLNGWDSPKLKTEMGLEKLTWRTFVNGTEIITRWNLSSTPTFYVINHKGVIRHKWVGSPADYKQAGFPDAKAIDAALEKLIRAAEQDGKSGSQ